MYGYRETPGSVAIQNELKIMVSHNKAMTMTTSSTSATAAGKVEFAIITCRCQHNHSHNYAKFLAVKIGG